MGSGAIRRNIGNNKHLFLVAVASQAAAALIELAGATGLIFLIAMAAPRTPGTLVGLAELSVWTVTLELRMTRSIWITPSRKEWRLAAQFVAAVGDMSGDSRGTGRHLMTAVLRGFLPPRDA